MLKRRGVAAAPWLAALLAVGLAGCAASPTREASTEYGIYLVEDGDELVRLDGSPEWERQTWDSRANLEPDVAFIVHDPRLAGAGSVASLQEWVLLEEVAHVRQEVDARTGTHRDASGNPWVASHSQAMAVPVDFGPVEGHPAMIMARPRFPLEPGLYSIRVGEPGDYTLARFGIEWDRVNRDVYANLHCVDRYAVGEAAAYFECDEEPPIGGEGLRITNLSTSRHEDNGVPTLVVTGRIENEADMPRRIPDMRARLLNSRGVEQSWNFQIDRVYILPNETIDFTSEVEYPMQNSERVVVSFLPSTTS